jgi:hypothetical protein
MLTMTADVYAVKISYTFHRFKFMLEVVLQSRPIMALSQSKNLILIPMTTCMYSF